VSNYLISKTTSLVKLTRNYGGTEFIGNTVYE